MPDPQKQYFKKGDIVKMIVKISQKGFPAGSYIRRMKEDQRSYQWFIDNDIIEFEEASLIHKKAWYKISDDLGSDPILTL